LLGVIGGLAERLGWEAKPMRILAGERSSNTTGRRGCRAVLGAAAMIDQRPCARRFSTRVAQSSGPFTYREEYT